MTRPPSGQGPQAAQVNRTNSTLNHLMPGTQRSWMTNNAPSALPSLRQSPTALSASGRRSFGQSTTPAQQQAPPQQPPQRAPAEHQRQGPERDEEHLASRQPQYAPTYVDSACSCNRGTLCPSFPPGGRRPGEQQPHGPMPFDKRLTGLVHSTPANVLPSPAPSDEPSPAALSNYKDSPNPQTVPIATVPRSQQNCGTDSEASDPVASTDPSMLTSPGPSALETQGAEASSSAEQAVNGLLLYAVQSPRGMPPPGLPGTNQYGSNMDGAVVPITTLAVGSSEGQSRPNTSGHDDHRDKRQRVA